MKLSEDKQKYTGTCDICNKLYTIRTQKDNYPEYYTDIYLECCDEFIHFQLPVN